MIRVLRRMYRGQTTADFYTQKKWAVIVSGACLVISFGSLMVKGLNLGIDFQGGVAFEVPAKNGFSVDAARVVLTAEKLDPSQAKIQVLSTASEDRVRVQLRDQPADTVEKLQDAFVKKAEVQDGDVSVATVSASWGRNITTQAVQALLIFFVIVSIYIAWKFEWRMALGALASIVHDIIISVGVYSVLGLEVTPATVVAFLTIMGYSLYDTMVIFDKMDENEKRFSGSRTSYGNIVNVSMNQVLMRSLNTNLSSILPVISLYVLGAKVLGAVTLEEFSVALIVGMVIGTYSSIYVAAPVVGILKERTPQYVAKRGEIARGQEMAILMATGAPVSRRVHARAQQTHEGSRSDASSGLDGGTVADTARAAEALLSHPPRPRKKSRR